MCRLPCFGAVQAMSARARAAVLALLSAFTVLLMSGCTSPKEYTGQQFLMDTVVEITVYSPSEEAAREAALAAFYEIKRIADLTDRFPEADSAAYQRSDVCQINSMAGIRPVQVSDDVLRMVEMAQQYSEITEGAFDITVGPLMDLWGFGAEPTVPDDYSIGQKLALTGMDKVIVDKEAKTVFLAQKGMALDLGGIAKGYAADKAVQVLKEKGISQAVINAGGNVVVLGRKNKRDLWSLGIQDPRDAGSLIGVLALENQAAVTSGDYQRFFEKDGVRYHHLLNPATGKPARGLISVTVVCDSSTVADIMSTALLVMGQERGFDVVSRLQGVEALFVSEDKEITATPGLKEKITVTPGEDYFYDPEG